MREHYIADNWGMDLYQWTPDSCSLINDDYTPRIQQLQKIRFLVLYHTPEQFLARVASTHFILPI